MPCNCGRHVRAHTVHTCIPPPRFTHGCTEDTCAHIPVPPLPPPTPPHLPRAQVGPVHKVVGIHRDGQPLSIAVQVMGRPGAGQPLTVTLRLHKPGATTPLAAMATAAATSPPLPYAGSATGPRPAGVTSVLQSRGSAAAAAAAEPAPRLHPSKSSFEPEPSLDREQRPLPPAAAAAASGKLAATPGSASSLQHLAMPPLPLPPPLLPGSLSLSLAMAAPGVTLARSRASLLTAEGQALLPLTAAGPAERAAAAPSDDGLDPWVPAVGGGLQNQTSKIQRGDSSAEEAAHARRGLFRGGSRGAAGRAATASAWAWVRSSLHR